MFIGLGDQKSGLRRTGVNMFRCLQSSQSGDDHEAGGSAQPIRLRRD